MKYWIQFVSKHHNIIRLDANKIKIENIGYDKFNRPLDHVITAHDGFYTVNEFYHDTGQPTTSWEEFSIKDYLGY